MAVLGNPDRIKHLENKELCPDSTKKEKGLGYQIQCRQIQRRNGEESKGEERKGGERKEVSIKFIKTLESVFL
jgi:hypothetical protein